VRSRVASESTDCASAKYVATHKSVKAPKQLSTLMPHERCGFL